MRRLFALALLPLLVACDVPSTPGAGSSEPLPQVTRTGGPQSVADFRSVQRRVEPVAERACRARTNGVNCDFNIIIDTRSELGANAYQTYDRNGRPILGITPALIRQMRNRDEIAFVIGHEAAHHIEGHIVQTQTSAQTGAILGAVLGNVVGLDSSGIEATTNIGGTIGARRFSKGFELEADSLGAQITKQAGYNAVRGVLYFMDAADPGDRFLGTHPPNADRIRVVQRSVGR